MSFPLENQVEELRKENEELKEVIYFDSVSKKRLFKENELMAKTIDGLEKEVQYLRDANSLNSYTNQMMHIKIERYEKALKDVINNYGKISPLGLLEIVQKSLKD
jgi:hypothetical protein